MGKGVIIGVRNLVYSKLVNDPASGQATYEAPKPISGAINIKRNANSSNGTLFADDGPYEVASTTGDITVEMQVADLPLEVQADLLGHSLSGGVLQRKSSDIPPWVAIGYKSLKSNGKYRYTWVHKGKFGVPETDNSTKGDSVEFQTPTIQGNFVRRDCDEEWERVIDEDHVDYVASMGNTWFNGPYGGPADTTPPTVTVAPANNATAVAATASIVWTFNEALALSTIHTGNFLLVNDATGANIPGTLSVNGARTVVTFTPSANLAAATAHRAIATTGVQNASGLALASPSVTKFTTA